MAVSRGTVWSVRHTGVRPAGVCLPLWVAAKIAFLIGPAGCSPDAAISSSLGRPRSDTPAAVLVVRPSPVELGTVSPGGTARTKLWVQNSTGTPRSVTQINTSCPCVSAGPLPLTVAAGGEASLSIAFDSSGEPAFRGGLAVELRGLNASGSELFRNQVTVTVADTLSPGPKPERN
jgi:hypothetical protein